MSDRIRLAFAIHGNDNTASSMRFKLRHLFFAVFIVAYALGIRSWAAVTENEWITAIGSLVGALIASIGCHLIIARPRIAVWTGTLVTFLMFSVHSIECVYHSPATEYLWGHPIVGQYNDYPQFLAIGTIIYTVFGYLVGWIGVGVGTLASRAIWWSGERTMMPPNGTVSSDR